MNPKTLIQIVLALLVTNDTITKEEAEKLITKADNAFDGQVLDALKFDVMLDLLKNPPKPQKKRETGLLIHEKPKIILE